MSDGGNKDAFNSEKWRRVCGVAILSAQVKRTAEKYDICVQHRVLMIRRCCERLTELMSGKNIRQKHSKGEAEKLQELLELLICAISDTGVLFHEIGVWRDLPNEWGWENSEKASRKITDAVRCRNFAYYVSSAFADI